MRSIMGDPGRHVHRQRGPRSSFSFVLDGLHVQWDAYDEFAQDPVLEGPRGAEPRFGTYLVRSAGCPPVVMGDCPVWSAVGRLDSFTPTVPVGDFPRDILGEKVLTTDEALAHVATTATAAPFLVGGWLFYVLADCVVPYDFPETPTPLLAVCDDGFRLSSSADDSWGAFRLVLLDDVGLPAGQAVNPSFCGSTPTIRWPRIAPTTTATAATGRSSSNRLSGDLTRALWSRPVRGRELVSNVGLDLGALLGRCKCSVWDPEHRHPVSLQQHDLGITDHG